MPMSIAPFFRAFQLKVLEPSGIYKTLNSAGYDVQVAEEAAGTKPTPPTVTFTYPYLGTSYTSP